MTESERPELPPPDTGFVEIDLDEAALDGLRRRAEDEGVAPDDGHELLRYLVYLGAAYIRADRVSEGETGDPFAVIRAQVDAFRAAGASLRFAYSEAVRDDGMSRRAIVAEEHFLGSFAHALTAMETEVEARRARVEELEEAAGAG
jgi:hypothetical protein